MTNTPLNADDEELDKAAQLLGIYLEEIDVDGYMPINVNRQTLAHIQTDRKKHELQAEIEANEAWYALGRMIDPREFVAEIGRLELKKQDLESYE